MKYALLIALTFAPAYGKIDKARDRRDIHCMKLIKLTPKCLKRSESMP